MSANDWWLGALEQLTPEEQAGALAEIDRRLLDRVVTGEEHMLKIGAEHHREQFKAIDGVGEIRYRINPTIFFHLRNKGWQADDVSDQRFMSKHYPEAIAHCGGTRTQIGHGDCLAPAPVQSSARWRRNYGPIDGSKH